MGSTGTIVHDIQMYCECEGIECHVAYAFSSTKEVKNGYQIGNSLTNKWHALMCRINGEQAYFSRLTTCNFLRYIDELKPDIVHFHNLHSNYIHLNMLLKHLAKRNIKTVVTLHDCWFYTGGCFHYTNAKCFKWMEGCGSCSKKKVDTPAFLLDKSSLILADRVKYFRAVPQLYLTGVSSWIVSEAQKLVFKNRPSSVVYNGVDLDIFTPYNKDLCKKLNLGGKKILLGPATKWLDRVNRIALDYFIHNLKPDQHLVIFGCTDTYQKFSDNVTLFGYTSNREELAQLYSMADVLVNCTREESMSLINVEAQACGTPVVTYDGTGVQETVDNKCGFTVKSGDHVKLFEVTQKVLERPSDPADCIKWVRENFEKNKNYEEYLRIYKEFKEK